MEENTEPGNRILSSEEVFNRYERDHINTKEDFVIRRKTVILAAVTCLAAGIFQNGWAQMKIGYIDTPKIMATWEPAVAAQKKLENEANAAYMELQKMEADIRDNQDKLEQQGLMYTEQKKKEKQKEIQDMYIRYQQVQQEKQIEINKRREELLKPVTDTINEAIKKVGDSEGYDYILDTAQGVLLYVKDGLELTDKIMAELKKTK
jgi:outer membrane protein